MTKYYLAVDIGASSGRLILGHGWKMERWCWKKCTVLKMGW